MARFVTHDINIIGVISSVRWEAARAGLEDAEYFMLVLDRLTKLRGLCHTGVTTCGDDVESVAQDALVALERVDEVVWGWPTSGWVESPPRRWNITEPCKMKASR